MRTIRPFLFSDRDRARRWPPARGSSAALEHVGTRSRPRPGGDDASAGGGKGPSRRADGAPPRARNRHPGAAAARSPPSTTPRSSAPARCRPRGQRRRRRLADRPRRRSSGSAATSAPRRPATSGDQPSAQITYRIPAAKWESALDLLRGLERPDDQGRHRAHRGRRGDQPGRRPRGADRNLQASETALQGIAAKATKISDVLEVQAS